MENIKHNSTKDHFTDKQQRMAESQIHGKFIVVHQSLRCSVYPINIVYLSIMLFYSMNSYLLANSMSNFMFSPDAWTPVKGKLLINHFSSYYCYILTAKIQGRLNYVADLLLKRVWMFKYSSYITLSCIQTNKLLSSQF